MHALPSSKPCEKYGAALEHFPSFFFSKPPRVKDVERGVTPNGRPEEICEKVATQPSSCPPRFVGLHKQEPNDQLSMCASVRRVASCFSFSNGDPIRRVSPSDESPLLLKALVVREECRDERGLVLIEKEELVVMHRFCALSKRQAASQP
jgi:hypothetical protein